MTNIPSSFWLDLNEVKFPELNLALEEPNGLIGIGGDLSIESFIIMDSILRFSSVFNQKIEESVIWPNLYSMCIKYAPFLVVNKQKYVDILKKQVELHYE